MNLGCIQCLGSWSSKSWSCYKLDFVLKELTKIKEESISKNKFKKSKLSVLQEKAKSKNINIKEQKARGNGLKNKSKKKLIWELIIKNEEEAKEHEEKLSLDNKNKIEDELESQLELAPTLVQKFILLRRAQSTVPEAMIMKDLNIGRPLNETSGDGHKNGINYELKWHNFCKAFDLDVDESLARLEKQKNDLKSREESNPMSITPQNPSLGSKTAKGGYKEEILSCDDLNHNNLLRSSLFGRLNAPKDSLFKKIKGRSKTDISNGNIKIQVKKCKKGQFGQVDRHWVVDIVKAIPELEEIAFMIQQLCEIPLKADNKYVDDEVGRKNLSTDNYSKSQLDNLINVLNCNKRKFLEFVFYGTDENLTPEYLYCVCYNAGEIREKITVYHMSDVIDFLDTQEFTISPYGETVIKLGKSLTIQRKGGDSKKKGGNQMATKLVADRLNIENKFEYIITPNA